MKMKFSMEFHGNSIFYIFHGKSFSWKLFHGIPWNSMEFHGIPWELHFPWNSMENIPWNSMEFHAQYQTEFHGIPWKKFHGIPWGYFTRVYIGVSSSFQRQNTTGLKCAFTEQNGQN